MSKLERWQIAEDQFEHIRNTRDIIARRAVSGDRSNEYRQRCWKILPRMERRVNRWRIYCNNIAPACFKVKENQA